MNTMPAKLGTVMLLAWLAGPATAQDHQQHNPQVQPAHPYAGLHKRTIKALSDRQIADLRAGRGMGLALTAELHGYPGPLHVLELKDELQLDDTQQQTFEKLFESMKTEAIAAGETLIASEQALDQRFAQKQVTPEDLTALTAQIGEAQGRLRAVHLKYHLTTADLLTPAQRERYAELRGYR